MSFPLNYGDYNCPPPFTPNCGPTPRNSVQLDATDIFYNLYGQYPSRLLCTGLPNGTSLNLILEALDSKICSAVTPNYASFNLYCLGQKYYISNVQQFAESISKELCITEGSITALSDSVNAALIALEYPQVTDPLVSQESDCTCGCEPTDVPCIGLLPTDNLQTVLNKMAAKICSCCAIETATLPSLNATSSNTIQFVTSGPNNFNITANAIVSSSAGNILTILSSGLYVPTPPAQVPQVLSLNLTTSVLTLSGGGGSVTLPPQVPQTLSVNCTNNQLTISNGNTIDLSCLLQNITVTQTPITPVNTNSINITATGTANTTISANLKLDNTQPNAATVNSNGLLVAPQIAINPQNSSTVTLTGSGTLNTTLVASAKIDSTQPNALSVTAGGLFVAPINQNPITVLSSKSLQLAIGGSLGNTIVGNVIIDSVTPNNALVLNPNGLYVPETASGNAYTVNNGLTATGTNFQLGGNLVKNTLINDPTLVYDFAAVTHRAFFGNILNYTPTNGSAIPNYLSTFGPNYNFNVLNRDNQNLSSSNIGVYSYYNLLAASDSVGTTGQVRSACWDDMTYTLPTGTSNINTGNQLTGAFTRLLVDGTVNVAGNVTVGSGGTYLGQLSAHSVQLAIPNGTTNATNAVISNLAAYASIGPYFYDNAGTGVGSCPNIENYYGLFLLDSTHWSTTNFGTNNDNHGNPLIANRYAIYQQGTTDVSIFFGPVQNAGGTVQFTSDERVKQNITSFTRGLDEINKLTPKNYQYTYNKDKTVTGIIAQDIQQVIPEAVTQGNFTTPDGTKYDDFRMVDQNTIFYAMLNAIKELSSQVTTLTNQVTELQNQNKPTV